MDLFFFMNPRPIELKRLKEICRMFENDPIATEKYLEGKKDYHEFAGRPRMMSESAQNYLRELVAQNRTARLFQLQFDM